METYYEVQSEVPDKDGRYIIGYYANEAGERVREVYGPSAEQSIEQSMVPWIMGAALLAWLIWGKK
jgi:hypothetical protein